MVIAADECPIISLKVFTSKPLSKARAANVCLVVWKFTLRIPAKAVRRLKRYCKVRGSSGFSLSDIT
jgi:hypothetical protein